MGKLRVTKSIVGYKNKSIGLSGLDKGGGYSYL
jgi:hypothetical protein